jgi:TIR domain/SIR2-like domain
MSASPQWDEDIWQELLGYIEERRVVPVVGRDLMQVTPNGGPPVSLDRFIAERLAKDIGVSLPDEELTLNAVVCAHIAARKRWPMLYSRVRAILEREQLEPPLVLRQLADITDFQLFLTTNFDLLLEQAINQVRFDGQPGTASLAYAPKKEPEDLPTSIRSLTQPVVYHLLGVQSTSPSYVLCDEDLLEFVYGLQAGTQRPVRLFEELDDQHLLLLGEGFSDWLSRLFMRITRSSRLSDRRNVMEVIAEAPSSHETGLFPFLRAFSTNTLIYPGGDATAFVGELHRRWMERHPARAVSRGPRRPVRLAAKGKDVFISYARQDFIAASTLKQDLEDAGFSVWFDTLMDQKPGRPWNKETDDNIWSCALFIPVISATTERRAEGPFRQEWSEAAARVKRHFGSSRPFLIPVVIDDTHGIEEVPEAFKGLHYTRLPGGRATETFLEAMHAAVDEVIAGTGGGGEAA